jgi:hypothetical protein
MIRVYCDTGAYIKALGKLESDGVISVHQFKYENRSKRIRGIAIPSELKYDELTNYTYDELTGLTYDELGGVNSKLKDILTIVGSNNRTDARHIDSAQMSGCKVFLTSDKGDIWTKRALLKPITGLSIFHVPTEWSQFLELVGSDG